MNPISLFPDPLAAHVTLSGQLIVVHVNRQAVVSVTRTWIHWREMSVYVLVLPIFQQNPRTYIKRIHILRISNGLAVISTSL